MPRLQKRIASRTTCSVCSPLCSGRFSVAATVRFCVPVVCLLVKAHAVVAMRCLEEAGGEGMLLLPLVAMPLLASLSVLHLWEFARVLAAADGGVIFRMRRLWKLVRSCSSPCSAPNPIASACLVTFPGAKPHDVWEPAVPNPVWLYKIGVQYVCPQHHYN